MRWISQVILTVTDPSFNWMRAFAWRSIGTAGNVIPTASAAPIDTRASDNNVVNRL